MKEITKGYPNWDIPLNNNIKEYNDTIGTEEMETTATTVKGAIKELKKAIDSNKTELSDKVQTNTADISNLKTKNTEITTQLNNIENNKQDKIEDSGWITLSLNSIFTVVNTVKIRKIGKIVTAVGSFSENTIPQTPVDELLCTLPIGFIPNNWFNFSSNDTTSSGSGQLFNGWINPNNGEIRLRNLKLSTTNICSLYGLTWMVE